MRTTILLTLAIFAVGCGAKPAETTTAPDPSAPKSELSEKLKTMSPEERAQYVQQHPDEIRGTYSGVTNNHKP